MGVEKNGWRCLIPLHLLHFSLRRHLGEDQVKVLISIILFRTETVRSLVEAREFTRCSGAASGGRYVIRRDGFARRPQRAVSEAISVTEPPSPRPTPLRTPAGDNDCPRSPSPSFSFFLILSVRRGEPSTLGRRTEQTAAPFLTLLSLCMYYT